MKKIMYKEYGSTDVMYFADVQIPNVESGEVLIDVKAAGINPTDIRMRSGKLKLLSVFTGRFPKAMGLDYAGVIAKVGPSVADFAVGDKVFGPMPLKGGSFTESIKVSTKKLRSIPSNLDFAQASTLTLNGGTAIAAVNKYVKPVENMKVFINGASGGVGLFMLQICVAKGAKVEASCGAESVDKLKELGAANAFDYKTTNIFSSGQKYDVVVDCSGHMKANDAVAILNDSGTFVTLTPDAASIIAQVKSLFGSKKVKGVMAKASERDMDELIGLVMAGKVQCVVGKTFPMGDAIEAHKEVEAGTLALTGKVVLVA